MLQMKFVIKLMTLSGIFMAYTSQAAVVGELSARDQNIIALCDCTSSPEKANSAQCQKITAAYLPVQQQQQQGGGVHQMMPAQAQAGTMVPTMPVQ